MITAALRRLLRLPSPRCGSALETEWVPMHDGVRLATHHFWPIDLQGGAPTILVRTPYGLNGGRSWLGVAARLLTESGYHVVVQDVRGRYASEGEFVPFESERRDGADTMTWLAGQEWCNGRIGVFGGSYLAYTAWCVVAEAPASVQAAAVQIGSGDLYALFYVGGAFSLSVALEWSLGVGEHEAVPRRRIDLERALEHLPVREADRVGLRTLDFYRDWVDHPRRDAYWNALHAPLPERPPATLLIAGWYDFFLHSQLAEYRTLATRAEAGATPPPRLVVGPWAHGLPARLGWWRHGIAGPVLRETIAHFDAHLREGDLGSHGAPARTGVRYFLAGADTWCEASHWPPPDVETRSLHLHADGTLRWSPAADGDATRGHRHDPASPTATRGGALFGLKGGIRDQRDRIGRDDLLVYESEPLARELTLLGDVSLVVHVSSDLEDSDVAAKLVDVSPGGRAENVCDGIVRGRYAGLPEEEIEPRFSEPGAVSERSVELGAVARRLPAGHRIRLELAAASFPRFDRNPGTRVPPGRAERADLRGGEQRVHHAGAHASHLVLPVQTGSTGA